VGSSVCQKGQIATQSAETKGRPSRASKFSRHHDNQRPFGPQPNALLACRCAFQLPLRIPMRFQVASVALSFVQIGTLNGNPEANENLIPQETWPGGSAATLLSPRSGSRLALSGRPEKCRRHAKGGARLERPP